MYGSEIRGDMRDALQRREKDWLRGRDLNPRPLGYEPNELPGCSTPRPKWDYRSHLFACQGGGDFSRAVSAHVAGFLTHSLGFFPV